MTREAGTGTRAEQSPAPTESNQNRVAPVAMHVGATLAVAREAGDEILRCAQNDRDGEERYIKAPLLKGAVSLKADWRIQSR